MILVYICVINVVYMIQRQASFLVLAFILIIAGTGCKKNENSAGYFYKITNNSSKDVNINVYRSLGDYNQVINIYYKNVVAAHSSLSLPYSQFTKGQIYYIDWYSDDFLFTNWFWTNVTVIKTMALDNDYSEFVISEGQVADQGRAVWMNGLNAMTQWKAVDAFTLSGGVYTSIWSTLPQSSKNLQLTLRKDFTATIKGQSPANIAIDTTIRFRVTTDSVNNTTSAILFGDDFTTYGTLLGNFNSNTHTFTGNKSNLLAYFPNIGYFQFSRQ